MAYSSNLVKIAIILQVFGCAVIVFSIPNCTDISFQGNLSMTICLSNIIIFLILYNIISRNIIYYNNILNIIILFLILYDIYADMQQRDLTLPVANSRSGKLHFSITFLNV